MEPNPGSSSTDNKEISIADNEEISIADNEEISIVYENTPPKAPQESLGNLEDIVNVQHVFFKWSINNISLFPDAEGIFCYSPTFELKETWWYLDMCPNSSNCGREGISLGLVRHHKDSGPENVVASYALGLENYTNKIWFKSEENVVFKKGKRKGLQTSVLGNLRNFLTESAEEDVSNDSRLSVVCEIYATYLSDKKVKKLEESPIDLSLSSDLVALFESQKKVDVLIEIRNHSVWVHKSVLCARSRTLARLLEGGKFFIQLSCSLSCLTCVIAYMYSGSFEHLVMKATFCVGLYELACDLCLPRLRDLLTPYRMEKRSRVEERRFKRTCTLYGFDLEELSGQNIETPVGFDKESGMSVKIVLRKLDSPPECVAVDVEIGGVSKVFHLDLNVSFLNKNCTPYREMSTDFLPGTAPEFRDSNLLFSSFVISNSDLQSSVYKGLLFINVECTKYILRNIMNMPADLNSLPCSRRNWIEELSADFKRLLKSGKLSDITLVAGCQKFRVHRSILAARSQSFHALFFEKNYLQNVLGIEDVEPRILWIMLKFVYCGTIDHSPDLTEEDLSKLRKVAEKCKIQSLVEICDQFCEDSE